MTMHFSLPEIWRRVKRLPQFSKPRAVATPPVRPEKGPRHPSGRKIAFFDLP
jgi:hypothetical protein